MQTPEEFAAMLDRCAHTAEGMGERLTDTYRVADLIRARDAEVRADERGRCSVVHGTLTDEALVDELVRRGVLTVETRAFIREPWECANPAHALHNHRGGFGEDCTFAPDATQRRYVTEWEADDD